MCKCSPAKTTSRLSYGRRANFYLDHTSPRQDFGLCGFCCNEMCTPHRLVAIAIPRNELSFREHKGEVLTRLQHSKLGAGNNLGADTTPRLKSGEFGKNGAGLTVIPHSVQALLRTQPFRYDEPP